MRILEEFINSKNGNMETCEDGMFANDNFICVADGATAKGKILWQNGKKGGYIAKEIALKTVANFNYDITAEQAIETITNEFKKMYKDDFEHFVLSPQDRIEASILIYSKAKKQIWSYGDCQLIIDGTQFASDKLVDELNSNMRSLYNNLLLKKGITLQELKQEDLGRKLIEPVLSLQSLYANEEGEFGYPVLNGISYNKNMIKIYDVQPGQEIVFASDGYPFLKSNLEESEEALRNLLKNDEFLINEYKSTKGLMQGNISYDDRTYLKFIAE